MMISQTFFAPAYHTSHVARSTAYHKQIIINSAQEVNNLIPTQVWVKTPNGAARGWGN